MKCLLCTVGIFCAGIVLFSAGTTSAQDLVIKDYTLISKKRVDRTSYDYTYQAEITNTGADVQNVIATLTINSPHTVVVEGSISFGDIPSGSTVTSSDAFTICQDRRYPFDPSALVWDISFESAEAEITLSSDPDDDLLFYATRGNDLYAYYYGFDFINTIKLTHVILENSADGNEVVIFNDDFLPIQWILTDATVVVYKVEEPFDPHSAFHVAVYEDQEDSFAVDIYPINLSTVIDEMQSETGQNFDNARAFMNKYNVSTFDELATLAKQTGPEQPRFIAAATGFSASAAALGILRVAQAHDASAPVSATAIQPMQVGALIKFVAEPIIQIAARMLAHVFARELNYGLGDPTGPVVDVLLCRGATTLDIFGICHHVFLRQGIGHCVDFCKTSLKCFTDICMPMEISAEVADRFVNR